MIKPRVLVFTTSYYPFVGGAEIAIQEIALRLKKRFDFFIVTTRFRRDLPKREVRPEGTIIRVGLGTSFDKYLLPLFMFTRPGLISFTRPGLVILGVDIGHGSLAAAIYKLFYPEVPFILNMQYGEGEKRLSSGRLGIIGLALRFMLKRADFVTAISSYLLDLSRSYGYRGAGEVVHNGVDIQKFQPRRPRVGAPTEASENSKIIITTSRLVPKNGIDTLIKAVAEVKKNIPGIQCWIIGDGPERDKLNELAAGPDIKFFGSVPYAEIPKYLHEADIFVRPSRSEGMGNSFVEALAAGIPIIGTPVGGITDIIEDGKTGLFARVDDPNDLADKIIQLFEDRELRERIVKNGQQIIEERFSWDGIAQKYAHIFYRGLSSIENRPTRVLIATPLYPPQLGGPAIYADNLAREFQSMGHRVLVRPFGGFLRWPVLVRHFLYFFSLWRDARKSDLIFALDYFSVGFPAAAAAIILRKPLVLRLEGDFLWEKFVERARKDVTLPIFYSKLQPLSRKERVIRSLSGWAMRRASRVVFSSEWRRKMVIGVYGIPEEKTAIIRNARSDYRGRTPSSRIVLWAGRMLYLKNLYRLIRAFSRINDGAWELHLVGDGPEKGRLEKFLREEKIKQVYIFPAIPRAKLLEKISSAAFFVLPSLSDVGPNVIADAVAAHTPFILTKESGYAELVEDTGILVNPLSERDIAEKLKVLMKESKGREYGVKLQSFSFLKTWPEVAQEWLRLFQNI